MSNLKTFIVDGKYSGKVRLTVRALDLEAAKRKFGDAEEDDIEVLQPENIEPDYNHIKQITGG